MIPKVTYTLNGAPKEIIFDGREFTRFTPKWTKEKKEYKNPFTGEVWQKSKGYYFSAVLEFDGLFYETLTKYADLWNKNVDDFKFFPNKDGKEFYNVYLNDEFEFEDDDAASAIFNFQLTFTGKDLIDVIMVHPDYFWGNREITWDTIRGYDEEENPIYEGDLTFEDED